MKLINQYVTDVVLTTQRLPDLLSEGRNCDLVREGLVAAVPEEYLLMNEKKMVSNATGVGSNSNISSPLVTKSMMSSSITDTTAYNEDISCRDSIERVTLSEVRLFIINMSLYSLADMG